MRENCRVSGRERERDEGGQCKEIRNEGNEKPTEEKKIGILHMARSRSAESAGAGEDRMKR